MNIHGSFDDVLFDLPHPRLPTTPPLPQPGRSLLANGRPLRRDPPKWEAIAADPKIHFRSGKLFFPFFFLFYFPEGKIDSLLFGYTVPEFSSEGKPFAIPREISQRIKKIFFHPLFPSHLTWHRDSFPDILGAKKGSDFTHFFFH